MDIDYKEVMNYSIIKDTIKEKRTALHYVAEDTEIPQPRLSSIMTGWVYPKSDAVAKIAWALKVPVSKVVEFKIDTNKQKMTWFKERELPYTPSDNTAGEVTYEPLRAMMNMYLDYLYEQTGKEKTVNDLFDLIEPCKRRNGLTGTSDMYKKAMEARGYKEGYKSKRTDRKYKAKGLIPATRTKLKNDRPVSMRTIYDICNFFGCSIDWVMSYK